MTVRAFGLAVIMFACTGLLYAQESFLQLRVTDLADRPIKGVRLIPVIPPKMPSEPTDPDGRTKLKVARYQVGKPISLELFDAPKGVILFPPIAPVPPSRCKAIMTAPPDPADIILVPRSQIEILQSSRGITKIVSALLESTLKRSFRKGAVGESRLTSLVELAALLDLEPSKIDKAIRDLSRNTTQTYEKGLLALYEQDYSAATKELSAASQGEKTGTNGKPHFSVLNVSYFPASSELAVGNGKSSRLSEHSTDVELDAAFFLGQAFYEQGKYRDAADTYEKLALRRPDDVIILNLLCGIYKRMGQYSKALNTVDRSLNLSKKIKDSEGEARAWMNRGSILFELNEVPLARICFRRSLEISRAAHDKESELLALRVIGGFTPAIDLDEFKIDISYLSQALELSKQLNDKAAEGSTLLLLGYVHLDVEKYTEAGEFFQQSIDLQSKIFGSSHLNVADGLKALAALYTKQKKYSEAEEAFERALQIQESALGPAHPDVVATIEKLGSLYKEQGEYSKAELRYKKALTIREGSNQEKIELVLTLRALAEVYSNEEKYSEAEVLLKRALNIIESTLGQDHVILIPILQTYESLLRKTNRDAEAMRIKARVDSIRG